MSNPSNKKHKKLYCDFNEITDEITIYLKKLNTVLIDNKTGSLQCIDTDDHNKCILNKLDNLDNILIDINNYLSNWNNLNCINHNKLYLNCDYEESELNCKKTESNKLTNPLNSSDNHYKQSSHSSSKSITQNTNTFKTILKNKHSANVKEINKLKQQLKKLKKSKIKTKTVIIPFTSSSPPAIIPP